MPDIVTFDPLNLRIVEIDAGGDNVLDVAEIYSEWKEWLKLSDNAKFSQAFRFVGGDPISDTQDLGVTYFLLNGWRIRPAESSHKLTLVGNIFTDPSGFSIFVATLGTFTVNTETRVSNLVDSSVSRLDLAQLLNAVYIDPLLGVDSSAEGVGVPTNPTNNAANALVIAQRENLRTYEFTSFIQLDVDHILWFIRGRGEARCVISAGVDVSGTEFDRADVTGDITVPVTVPIVIDEGKISGLTGFVGNVGRSLISGLITLATGDSTFSLCGDGAAGPAAATIIDMVGTGRTLSMNAYSGGIEIRNLVDGSEAVINMIAGRVVIDSTCVGGNISIRGVGRITDNSAGTVVDDTGFVHSDTEDAHLNVSFDGTSIDMLAWLDREGTHSPSVPTSAVVDWYNPDGTLLFQETSVTPNAQGQFRMSRTQALVGNAAYTAVVSVTDRHGTVSTRRGVPTVGP